VRKEDKIRFTHQDRAQREPVRKTRVKVVDADVGVAGCDLLAPAQKCLLGSGFARVFNGFL